MAHPHQATLPPPARTTATWRGEDLQKDEGRWVWQLTDKENKELIHASRQALRQVESPVDITLQDFILPHLSDKLRQLKNDLIQGLGFKVIRGLPATGLSQHEMEAIFVGIGTHIGNKRPQNANGDLLGHVRDVGKASSDPNVRIYQTSERQHFHTDSADVVGLLCLRPAMHGGESLLVSAETVYTQMWEKRPDLLRLLLEPIATDRRGEVPPGMKPFTLIPVFSHHDGKLTVYYQRQYIESAQRFEDAPRLTDRHQEALDLFDSLCNDPALYLSMHLQGGDMQFVYNHALLHDRTSFQDHEDPTRKRYLRRLWLSVPEDRELPQVFAERFGNIEPGNRGGIYLH